MIRIFPYTTRVPAPDRLLHLHRETGHAFWLQSFPGHSLLAAVELDQDGTPQWGTAHIAEINVIREQTDLAALRRACEAVAAIPAWNSISSADPQGVAA